VNMFLGTDEAMAKLPVVMPPRARL
jgi:hypothetical protein